MRLPAMTAARRGPAVGWPDVLDVLADGATGCSSRSRVTDTDSSRYVEYLLLSPTVSTPSASSDGRSTRWDEHRATRRRELVEASLRAIRQHGAAVGMDEIAAVAGTSKTVVYRHFTDRQGLYAAVCESVDALILRDLGQAMGADSGHGVDLASAARHPRELIEGAIDA